MNQQGTFTGFVKTLADLDIDFSIVQGINSVTIKAERHGRKAEVSLSRKQVIDAGTDICKIELQELINALL